MKKFTYFLFVSMILGCWTDSYKPIFQTITLTSKSGKTIYLKKNIWGMTFDHQVSVISNSDKNEWKPDSTKEYIFKGLEPFFYKFSNDSLFVFTRVNAQIPPNAHFNVPIIQKEMGSNFIDLFDLVNKGDSTLIKF